MIEVLGKNNENCNAFQRHHFKKKYEFLKVGNDEQVIFKRVDTSDRMIYMVPVEDLYDKLFEAHIQTGHGGREKIIYYAKNKWRLPKVACNIFVSCCKTCNKKRGAPRKGIVILIII